MPSLNRLLVIAVLSLSVYVQAAPVRDATGSYLGREIVATEHNAIVAPVDNFDEVNDDFDTTDSDDEIELGSGVQDSSTPEDLALRKGKANLKPAPKPPKVTPPKQKSTKAVPPKTATKPPPQTTKATTTKLTMLCYPRAYNYVAQLFRRDNPEFIGWHGTNSDTAAFWTSQGQLVQPVNADGLLDFLGLGPNTTDGGSGAESAIGPGVYVIDDQETAIAFANNNAQANPNTTAQLCAIFAKSSATWRTAIPKAFIPEDLVGDSADATTKAKLEQARLDHIAQAVPGVNATSVVKFALLDPQRSTGQLVLPAQIADQFTATCFSADGGAAPSGTSTFPDFSYNGTTLRGEWNIASETAGTGDCA
ncbi:hypothetical protein GSI_02922 [Ganoderma sinense ZZ0214-1]|uniref:Uncharacterized protein n=1 Tax=Ganoderma sinense ZZ0214-1 TaxID=1077348 RepID=A0A2G8SN33_9APHY|nr:hypothetical protein GSI_02922 [Ganoderma sinense ZZ0214-1]